MLLKSLLSVVVLTTMSVAQTLTGSYTSNAGDHDNEGRPLGKGVLTADVQNLIATSDDGQWTVRVPRMDLVAPSVASTFQANAGGLSYRFAISNGADAARGIQIIVVGSFRAQWMEPARRVDGWMGAGNGWNHLGDGIAPGHAEVFSFATDALPGVIPIYLFTQQGAINIPEGAPAEFQQFVWRNAMPDRNSVQVLAIGPKLQPPLTFETLKADMEATGNLPGFGWVNELTALSTPAALAARLETSKLDGMAGQYVDALRFNLARIQ